VLIHLATDNDIHPARFGATQRTMGLARGLARRHDVRALCVVPNRSAGAASERVDGVTLVRTRAWYTSLAWRLERAHLAPLFVAARGHRHAARRLVAALGGTPDVFAADLLLTPLFAASAAPFKTYMAHNFELGHFVDTRASGSASARWRDELERLERAAVEAAALVVACTAEDAARFVERYGAARDAVHVIANGWDDTRLGVVTPESRARARAALGLETQGPVALFVGSDVPHNRAALAALLEHVAPALARQGGTLLVAGSVSRARARGAHVRVLGEVDDLAPVLHAADVGLNPAAAGGGSNVKLPTYLASGLAALTTPHGLRGYPELSPYASVAPIERFAEAIAARPRSWAADGGAMPEPIAALGWTRLGERLAATFAARVTRAPELRAGGVGA
jgi:hypothetical protein